MHNFEFIRNVLFLSKRFFNVHINKLKNTYNHIIFNLPVEAIIWVIGLLLLAFYNPGHQEHMSLCVFNNLGFKYCPGCGLGRSISYFLHGDLYMSFKAHPIGIAAVLILVFRIIKLLKEYFKRLKLKYNYYGNRS